MAPGNRRVNFVTPNNGLKTKIRLGLKRIDYFEYVFSEKPLFEGGVYAYIVPEDIFLSSKTMERLGTLAVVIGYGEPGLLDIAFCSGCDDYLKEPWSPSELYTRLTRFRDPTSFTTGHTVLNLRNLRLCSEDSSLSLTVHEALILRTLIKNRDIPVPREALYLVLNTSGTTPQSRSVDMHIASLRKKIRTLIPGIHGPGPIKTARGIGYMLDTQTVIEKPVDKFVDM